MYPSAHRHRPKTGSLAQHNTGPATKKRLTTTTSFPNKPKPVTVASDNDDNHHFFHKKNGLLRHGASHPFKIRTKQEKEEILNRAAIKITQTVRKVAARKAALRTTQQLKRLRDIVKDANELKKKHERNVFTKPVLDERGRVSIFLLGYIEFLEKLLLKTDEITTYGQDIIRHRRKATVGHVQVLLAEADAYKKDGSQPK
eukprot:comp5216_c0_seq1/m.1256 comp5216_c0_seq1/g.1256  ORF comp5216_c0_seq1/g.1256 comp5216_c0_seq1/m.1256 type:complete len:200 (-) comp5216_c0_seq1:216-815(-)